MSSLRNFAFLDLPELVRNEIYLLLLPQMADCAITRTNHQIYEEAARVLWLETCLRVHITVGRPDFLMYRFPFDGPFRPISPTGSYFQRVERIKKVRFVVKVGEEWYNHHPADAQLHIRYKKVETAVRALGHIDILEMEIALEFSGGMFLHPELVLEPLGKLRGLRKVTFCETTPGASFQYFGQLPAEFKDRLASLMKTPHNDVDRTTTSDGREIASFLERSKVPEDFVTAEGPVIPTFRSGECHDLLNGRDLLQESCPVTDH